MINLIPTAGVVFSLFDGKAPAVSRDKVINMIATSKNKIVEVLAYAREVSIRHENVRDYTRRIIESDDCKSVSCLK